MPLNNFFVNILFSFFAIILNFWFKTYLATNFSKIDLGVYFTLIDIISMFMIVFVGARSSMVVHFAKTGNDALILNLFRIGLFIAFCISSVFLMIFFDDIFDFEISNWLLVLFVFSQAIYIYFFNQLGMRKLYKLTNAITIIEPISIIVIFFALKFFYGLSFSQLMLSTIFDMFVLAFIMKFFSGAKEPEWQFQNIFDDHAKQFTRNSLLASFEFLVGMLSVYLAVLFFAKYYGADALADFQVVVKTIYFYFLTLFAFPIFKFVFPEISSMVAKEDFDQIKKSTTKMVAYTAIVSLCCMGLIYYFSDYIIQTYFGANYQNSAILLKITSLAFAFVLLNSYFTSLLKAFGKFKETLFVRIFGLVSFVCIFYISRFFIHDSSAVIISFVLSHFVIFLSFLMMTPNQLK